MPTPNQKRKGSRQKILEYFLANKGIVVNKDQIREASGNVSEWARRTRELRTEQGYQILTHHDRANLRPGEYLMETDKRLPVMARDISAETRAWVLNRNGFTCQACGAAAGDDDPINPNRTVRLTIGHIVDKSKGGSDDRNNLRAQCSACNEGLQNTALPNPDRIHLLSQVRRATIDDQRALLDWLNRKFG